MLHRLAPTTACALLLIFSSNSLSAALSTTAPATQSSLARQLAGANARVKAAHAVMEAAKLDAIHRYDAGKGRALVQDLADKAAEVEVAVGPQARINALSALARARFNLETGHCKAIEDDPGVDAATRAVAAAHADRESLRMELDARQVAVRE